MIPPRSSLLRPPGPRFRPLWLLAAAAAYAWASIAPAAVAVAPRLLIIEAAQDTAGSFQALDLPELGRRVLVWPEGVLVGPAALPWLDDGAGGLAFAWPEEGPVGLGAGGRFDLAAGRYDLDTPLLLAGGELTVYLSAGRLEIEAGRLVYSRPQSRRDTRGDFYILAGLVLATALLLRAVRRRTRRR